MDQGDIEIVTGTYEELLLGYKLVENEGEWRLEQSFTDHSHTGCIKSVTISKKGVLASGGTDETIRLFNLRKRTELGSLMEHEGAVTCVQFYGGSHLFSASLDKTICIWKNFTWESLKTLRGHKGGINSISIHPSGKLALSVGDDKTMHTWNLVNGRSAYTTNVKQAMDIVAWSLTGDYYVTAVNNTLNLYKTETAAVHRSIQATARVQTLLFIQDTVLVYSGDGGEIIFYDIEKETQLLKIDTETNRVRGLASYSFVDKDTMLLVSVSSDGFIKVYQIYGLTSSLEYKLLTEHNTKFRLTCVAMTPPKVDNSAKKTDSGGQKSVTEEVVKNHSDSEADSGKESEEVDEPPREKLNKRKRKNVQDTEDTSTLKSAVKKKKIKKKKTVVK